MQNLIKAVVIDTFDILCIVWFGSAFQVLSLY